ncbi:Uncharacterised protein [Candidatus Tiddalikarchaeum anstoanum]|nr:Uncharacterised protein [Candidatus Tiddalikarchaeum anstoanum]
MAETKKLTDAEKKVKKEWWKDHLKDFQAKDIDGWPVKYYIQVNTPFQSLSKYYLMILDELRAIGDFDLAKVSQTMAASPTSGFYGDVSQRKAYAKEQFDKSMQIITGIIQTVTKLIYSLREFDLIIHIFDDISRGDSIKKFAAEQNLKRIYLDEVDIKKGRGSIHQMSTTQGLEFVALRDSFMVVSDLKSIDDLKVNDRIKRILKDRFNEYLNWSKEYEKDIRGRKKIQMQFLTSQVESLKMQVEWAKPYYILMKQLEISSGVTSAELIPGFDSSLITARVRAFKGGINKAKPQKSMLVTGFANVDFQFRTRPILTRTEQGQSYQHVFRVEVTYTPYVMTNEQYNDMVQIETLEDIDFLKDIVGNSLDAIKDDLQKYVTGGQFKEAEKPKPNEPKPFEFLLYPFEPLLNVFSGLFKPAEKKSEEEAGPELKRYKLENDLKNMTSDMIKSTFESYENFKDENGWMTWTGPLS